ncbi:ABC transporter [Candidatus Peregrinibacteria bacterium]|nr:MAG: ABC transporter [Candidatus Peregrinibacteria bacterium]
MPILEFENIKKIYSNTKEALKGVTFTINKGEFVALLGPNGAGKSTLINILAGNVRKSEGNLTVDGINFDEDELSTKRKIGIVPQEISHDSFFTVNEVLVNQSGYFGIKNNQDRIDMLLTELSLMDKKHVNTKALSGGMKRRLLIAKAMIHDPDIIILDEPTAGVDIELRQNLYLFLQKLHKSGKTIILTTHYMEEAEKLCQRMIIMRNGEIVADKSQADLKKEFPKQSLENIFLKLTR